MRAGYIASKCNKRHLAQGSSLLLAREPTATIAALAALAALTALAFAFALAFALALALVVVVVA